MLAELINDLNSKEESKPQRLLEALITSWYEEQGTKEDKKVIYNFALENNLLFMLPTDWFEDQELMKAEEPFDDSEKKENPEGEEDKEKNDKEPESEDSEKEGLDTSTIVFNIQTNGTTAEAIRQFMKFLSNSAKEKEKDAIVKFMSGDEELPDAVKITAEDIDIKQFDEDYLKKEDLSKALLIEVTDPSTLERLQSLIDMSVSSDSIRLDEDSIEILPTDKISGELHFDTRDNQLIIEAGDEALSQLENLFTVVADHGNGGHSFNIDGDTSKVFWDGDGDDRLVKVDLVKAFLHDSPLQHVIQSYRVASVLNEQYAHSRAIIISLQEELAPYGVMVGTDNIGGIILNFQEGFVRDVVRDKLEDLGLSSYIREVCIEDIHGTEIVFVYIDLAEQVDPAINKAKKGTPGYEKWLESYRSKRQKKSKETSKENSEIPSIEDQIKRLLAERKKDSPSQRLFEHLDAMEREQKLNARMELFQPKKR